MYHGTINQCERPNNNKQYKNIREAVENVDEGTYIYQEGDYYIPFEKFREKIWFNATSRVKIVDIKTKLEENVWTSNTKNYLAKEQYNNIYSMASSMFIDPRSSTYRDEFLINNILTIPKYFWERINTFDEMFHASRAHYTYMFLDDSGKNCIPLGIVRDERKIILNDRTKLTWKDFKAEMARDNLIKYQNLDFQGLEYKLSQNILDKHYEPPAQQIARIHKDPCSG